MKGLTICLLFNIGVAWSQSKSNDTNGLLPLWPDSVALRQALLTQTTAAGRARLYDSAMAAMVARPQQLNCADGQIDFWRLRRCCTDRAAYAWQDTVVVMVTDRITNWNTFPWLFQGTTMAIHAGDTIPHTVNIRVRDRYNWEATVALLPGNWSYSVAFLSWVETRREISLINFTPGAYTILAELRATGYQGVTIEVPFRLDYPTLVGEAKSTQDVWLAQNVPNPATSSTTIRYGLPSNLPIRLSLYNILGQEISLLVDQYHNKGEYTIEFNAAALPSGVYFIKMVTPGKLLVRKMTIIAK